ncbi:MAG: glycosyltransferase family 39 protein [Vicinamibacteria bacterium]|nr:glycosyltransferase family 39 protein [Vicinamibacteria bacterium]
MPEKTRGRVRIAIVAALLAAGFGVQLYFFNRYPQPILFGDPALYYQEGKRLQDAIGQVCHGAPISQVWASLQGTFHFAGAGLVFAGLDALKTYDLAFLRGAFAIFNTIGMLGAFLLGQRLANSYAGGLAALLIAVFHPSFATHTGRLYPDPLTGCLLVWATYFFSVAIETPRTKWMLASGVTLGLAFCVRSQLMLPATFLLLLIAILTAPNAQRRRDPRQGG